MVKLETLANQTVRLVLRPNCSMSWQNNVRILLVVTGFLACLSAVMASKGAWMVMPFAGIEVAALAAAMYATLKDLDRQEVLTLENGVLTVEWGASQPDYQLQVPEGSVNILMERPHKPLSLPAIDLVARGHCYKLGFFLNRPDRFKLASLLKNKFNFKLSRYDQHHRESF